MSPYIEWVTFKEQNSLLAEIFIYSGKMLKKTFHKTEKMHYRYGQLHFVLAK